MLPLCADQDPLSKVLNRICLPWSLAVQVIWVGRDPTLVYSGPTLLLQTFLDTFSLCVTSHYGERIFLEAGNHDLARFKIPRVECTVQVSGHVVLEPVVPFHLNLIS